MSKSKNKRIVQYLVWRQDPSGNNGMLRYLGSLGSEQYWLQEIRVTHIEGNSTADIAISVYRCPKNVAELDFYTHFRLVAPRDCVLIAEVHRKLLRFRDDSGARGCSFTPKSVGQHSLHLALRVKKSNVMRHITKSLLQGLPAFEVTLSELPKFDIYRTTEFFFNGGWVREEDHLLHQTGHMNDAALEAKRR